MWLSSKKDATAKVRISAKPHRPRPRFTVCQPPGGQECTVALTGGQPTELQARVGVAKHAQGGSQITLYAHAQSSAARAPASGSAHVQVSLPPSPSPTPTPTPSPSVGSTLPPGTFPPQAVPSASLPLLPVPAANPASAFPQITPAGGTASLPPAKPAPMIDVSSNFPLDTPLLSGQILGLAVLAAAVTIAVARLSLRGQRPEQGKDDG